MQRTLKFVKYLPYFGWRPIVLTPRHPGYEYLDRSLVKEIPPEAKIYRTAYIEPYAWAATAKRRFSSGMWELSSSFFENAVMRYWAAIQRCCRQCLCRMTKSRFLRRLFGEQFLFITKVKS